MNSNRIDSTLGEIIAKKQAKLQTGPFGTILKANEYSKIGSPIISVGEIREGFIQISSKTPKVGKSTISRLPMYLLRENDIVFGRKGSTHRNALIKKNEEGFFLGSDGIRLRVTCDSICPAFLSYQLRSKKSENWLKMNSEGTTMPSLNQEILSRFPIVLYPFVKQKRIANILGKLDKKIELNKAQNQTLERISKSIFKSWFIDFDPVQAKSKNISTGLPNEISNLFPDSFEDSSLGNIPINWNICSLLEIAKWSQGKSWKKENRVEFSNIRAFGANGEIGYSSKYLSDSRVIIIGKIGSCGAINNYKGKFWISNNAFFIEEKSNKHLEFVRWVIDSVDFSPYIGGSSNPYMPMKNFENHLTIKPPFDVMNAFCDLVRPKREKIEANNNQILLLRSIRDIILPKLISGEIEIIDAEKIIEEAGI